MARSSLPEMVRQEGLEPPTHSLEGCCSIHLSYWRFIVGVGAPGFEPGTSCSQSRRDTRLRYAPLRLKNVADHEMRVNAQRQCVATTSRMRARDDSLSLFPPSTPRQTCDPTPET